MSGNHFAVAVCWLAVISVGASQDVGLPVVATSEQTTIAAVVASSWSSSSVPAKQTVKPLVTTICQLCECYEKQVVCVNQTMGAAELQDSFWVGGSQLVPIISFRNNEIHLLSRFPNTTALVNLQLGQNNILEVSWNAFAAVADHLSQLDLSQNYLTYDSFLQRGENDTKVARSLSKLRILDLSGNRLESLPLATFGNLSALQTLLLANNSFEYIFGPTVESLAGLAELRTLDLSGNQLSTLPPRFLNRLQRLETLNLAGNRFAVIPAELGKAVALRSLDLSGNPLGNLEGSNVFPEIAGLAQLTLNNLPELHHIGDQALSSLQSLEVLRIFNNSRLSDIHANALSKYDEFLFVWPQLRELQLNDNNLTTIHPEMLNMAVWTQVVQRIELHGNPWNCTCSLNWMQRTLLPAIREKMRQSAICGEYSDPSVRGISLDYVGMYVASGYCSNQYSLEAILLVSIFLSLFFLIAGCILRLARRVNHFTNPDGRGIYKRV